MNETSNNLSPTYLLSQTYELLKSALHRRLRINDLNITVEQLGILRILFIQKHCVSMQFISDHARRDNSAITRIIDNLEKKEYIDRTLSKTDRRVKHICISKPGIKIYKKASKVANQHVSEAMIGISHNETEHLINILNKIQHNLKK